MLKKLAAISLILIVCVLLSASGWKTDAETLRERNAKTLDQWMSTKMILLEDGTVVSSQGAGYKDWTDVVSVSAAETYTAALRKDGTVVVDEGYGDYRSSVVSEWKDIVDLCANFHFCCVGLKSDGTLVFSNDGFNDDPTFQVVRKWKDIVSIESCFFFIAALHPDGTVEAANCGTGEIYDLSEWTDIVQIAVSEGNVFGLRADGKVLVGGMQMDFSGVEEWTDVVSVFTDYPSPIGLRADGTLLVLDNYKKMGYLRTWDNMAAVAPYGDFGAHTDGTLVFANENSYFRPTDVKAKLPWLPLG